jgi:hypothetical protein
MMWFQSREPDKQMEKDHHQGRIPCDDDTDNDPESGKTSTASTNAAASALVNVISVLLMLPLLLPGTLLAWIQNKRYMQQQHQPNQNPILKLKEQQSSQEQRPQKTQKKSDFDRIIRQNHHPSSSDHASSTSPVSVTTATTATQVTSRQVPDCCCEAIHNESRDQQESSRWSWFISRRIDLGYSSEEENHVDYENEDNLDLHPEGFRKHATQQDRMQTDATKRDTAESASENYAPTSKKRIQPVDRKSMRRKAHYDPEVSYPLIVIGILIFFFGFAIYLGLKFSDKSDSAQTQYPVVDTHFNDNNANSSSYENTFNLTGDDDEDSTRASIQYNDTDPSGYRSNVDKRKNTTGSDATSDRDVSKGNITVIVVYPYLGKNERTKDSVSKDGNVTFIVVYPEDAKNETSKTEAAENNDGSKPPLGTLQSSSSSRECVDANETSIAELYNTTIEILAYNDTMDRKYDCDWLQIQSIDVIIDICNNPIYYFYYYSRPLSKNDTDHHVEEDNISNDDDDVYSQEAWNENLSSPSVSLETVHWFILQQLNQYCQGTCGEIGGRIYNDCIMKTHG